MDYDAIKQQFDSLPHTFKRFGPDYLALIVSICTALARSTGSIDAVITDLQMVASNKVTVNPATTVAVSGLPSDDSATWPAPKFLTAPMVLADNTGTARWGWLDSFAKLYGLHRNLAEIDSQLRTRLFGTLTAPHGSATSISSFVQLALGLQVFVTENFVTPSYQLNFLIPPTTQTLQNVVDAIAWVRPAGVPFLPLFTIHGGLFLTSDNYFGGTKVSGSYLARSQVAVQINIAPNTNNPKNYLPTTYLTDPYITGAANT